MLIRWLQSCHNIQKSLFQLNVQLHFSRGKHSLLKFKREWIDHYCVIYTSVNTLRPRQNCHHFTDDIFKCIFLNKDIWILLNISLKFVHKVRINNIPALVQTMAWHRPGDKPLSEPITVSLLTHIHVHASLGLIELKFKQLIKYFHLFYDICENKNNQGETHRTYFIRCILELVYIISEVHK